MERSASLLCSVFMLVATALLWAGVYEETDSTAGLDLYKGQHSAANFFIAQFWTPLLFLIAALTWQPEKARFWLSVSAGYYTGLTALYLNMNNVGNSNAYASSYNNNAFFLGSINQIREYLDIDNEAINPDFDGQNDRWLEQQFAGAIFVCIALFAAMMVWNGAPYPQNIPVKHQVYAAIAAVLGFMGLVVLWTSDTAQDVPTVASRAELPQLWERLASYNSLFVIIAVAMWSAVGSIVLTLHNRTIYAEFMLLFLGLYGVWTIKNVFDFGDMGTPLAEGDTSRVRFGIVCTILAVFAAISCALRQLDFNYDQNSVGVLSKNQFMSSSVTLFAVLCLITGAALLLNVIGDVEDREYNFPQHSANAYVTISSLGLIIGIWIQRVESNFFKPLMYVSIGIAVAMMLGIQNVGTHNSELWMIDLSFAGINRLRIALENVNDDKAVWESTYGTSAENIREAMAGSILIYFGGFLGWVSTLPKMDIAPAKATLFGAVVSFVCFLIGAVCVWTNVVSDLPEWSSIRTTNHLFQSPENAYFKFVNLGWLSFLVFVSNAAVAFHQDKRSAVASAWNTAWLTYSLVIAFQVAQSDSKDCGTFWVDINAGDVDEGDECSTLTTGLVFMFLQTIASLICLWGFGDKEADPKEVAIPPEPGITKMDAAPWANSEGGENQVTAV